MHRGAENASGLEPPDPFIPGLRCEDPFQYLRQLPRVPHTRRMVDESIVVLKPLDAQNVTDGGPVPVRLDTTQSDKLFVAAFIDREEGVAGAAFLSWLGENPLKEIAVDGQGLEHQLAAELRDLYVLAHACPLAGNQTEQDAVG